MKLAKTYVIVLLIFLAAGIVMSVYLINRVPFTKQKPAVGETAPDIFIADIKGNMMKLSQFRGRVVLLNFWASWCPPCKEELKMFQKAYEKYEQAGFVVFAVATNDISASIVFDMRLAFPVAVANDKVKRDYGNISNVPVSFLIDKEGRIIKKLNKVYAEEALGTDIENLLKTVPLSAQK